MLIVGLGNPGKEFEHTFHNVGFLCVDALCKVLNGKFNIKACDAVIAKCIFEGKQIILAKPQTYMNRSGDSVAKLKKKFNVKDNEILTISDDIDLNIGTFRFRESGSAGTHNGLRSIVFSLNSTLFKRIRIGIGKNQGDLAEYVLSKMSGEIYEVISSVIDQVVDFVLTNVLGSEKWQALKNLNKIQKSNN